MAGFEKLNLCSTESPNDHYQREAQMITINAEPNDHYQRNAQKITTNAEPKLININAEPKSITINAPGEGARACEEACGGWGAARA
jgi:hypothetical protein